MSKNADQPKSGDDTEEPQPLSYEEKQAFVFHAMWQALMQCPDKCLRFPQPDLEDGVIRRVDIITRNGEVEIRPMFH